MINIEFCTWDAMSDFFEEERQIEIPEYEIIEDKPKRKKKNENKILRKVVEK